MVGAIRTEFLRYKALGEGAMAQLADSDLTAAAPGSNSIAVICQHIGGNLRSRFTDFLESDGEKPWRKRDEEFEPQLTTRAQILDAWNAGWTVLLRTLDALSEADLERRVTIRRQELTAGEALVRALAHVSYHVGQIVYAARATRGEAWTSLSIPKGQSAQYNDAVARSARRSDPAAS